jgi:hypothetical protein
MSATYTVIGQLERAAPDPESGQTVPGVVVTARSAKTGTAFSVFVPLTKYTADNVNTLLSHRLAVVDEVADLTGEEPPAV